MKKLAKTIVSEMINSNMLDFNMRLSDVREVIEQVIYDEDINGNDVDYDLDELLAEYRKQYIQMT